MVQYAFYCCSTHCCMLQSLDTEFPWDLSLLTFLDLNDDLLAYNAHKKDHERMPFFYDAILGRFPKNHCIYIFLILFLEFK